MVETLGPNQIPPEVLNMRRWIEQVVISKGICPPLVKLANGYKDEQGVINWNGLSREVDIVSHIGEKPYGDVLEQKVGVGYRQFIENATQGNAPLTKIFVLPDFDKDRDCLAFMVRIANNSLKTFLSSESGQAVMVSAFTRLSETAGYDRDFISDILRNGAYNINQAANDVIFGCFNPVPFFGQEISDSLIQDFTSERRGPRERAKILSRAPYYGMQVVNTLRSKPLVGNLNQQKLYKRNTGIALKTDLQEYESLMRQFRE
jgi:hypothetical protein